jgi:serine/threonine-protein kinase
MVMEFVAGETLEQRIRRDAPLPPREVRDIGGAILDALAHAHAAGIIHRDVKPANVVLRGEAGEPVLMDFGVAHMAGADLTRAGEILGTPAFLAPEQLHETTIDHRADLFAVGVLLQLALTGQRPFDGTVPAIMHAICFGEPAKLPANLAAFAPLLERALAKDPDDRFPDAASFARALRMVVVPGTMTDDDVTMLRPPPVPATAAEIAAMLDRAGKLGVEARLLSVFDDALRRIPPEEQAETARICGGPGLHALLDLLLRTAPLPGQKPERIGHWADGLELLRIILPTAMTGPRAEAARAAGAEFTYRLAAGVLAYGSDVAAQLAASQDGEKPVAPDVGLHALMLLRVDSIAFGLGTLGATRERRMVEAMGRVIAGQVLRRAAASMLRYVRTRDEMAHFDVAGLLVGVEDLIALAARLGTDAAAGIRSPDAVAVRSLEALEIFLEALTGLIAASAGDLDAALADARADGEDEAIGAFIGNLKQVVLIHRFCLGLEADAFQTRLAQATQSIYGLCLRLAEVLLAEPPQARIAALYEMSVALGWRALSARLLAHMRGVVVPAGD